ncbi:MAG: alanine racemase [Candidatus Binatia bacterium]
MKFRPGRPTVAEIDRAALRSNFAEVRKHVKPEVAIVAVLKADAYGHGIGEVAQVLEKAGAKLFGVATVEEGVAIREAGVVHAEVLVLSGFVADQVEQIFHNRLTPVVCDIEMARILAQRLRGSMRAQPVHVKADTGLGRLGVPLAEMPVFLDELKKIERLRVVGVCSHLGSATKVDGPAIERQVQAFIRAGELCAIHGSPVKIRHLANSAAVLARPDLQFEMVRPGLILYGLYPDGAGNGALTLRPAMRLRTRILQLRKFPAGTSIGYDQTFVTSQETLVATLPIGYADGYPRGLSNCGQVLVRGQRAPVIGRVSMDLTMIDVTGVPGVERGDEVVLWGKQGEAEIRVDEVAERAATISYQLLTTVGGRVPRVYIN